MFLRTFLIWAIITWGLIFPETLNAQTSQEPIEEGIAAFQAGDYESAFLKFEAAQRAGNLRGAQHIWLMYSDDEAVKWFHRAAERGLPGAQYHLGEMYRLGEGVRQNKEKAFHWIRSAAEQGYTDAQYDLGIHYIEGTLVPLDYQEAVKWFRKAAEQSQKYAQFNLGLMYAKGEGVPQDYVQAHMWFNLASITGDADAVKNREFVANRMTAEQIAEAQKMVREWMQKHSDSVE